MFLGDFRAESISLAILASRVCPHSLACGPTSPPPLLLSSCLHWLWLPLPSLKNACGYIWPIWIIQDNFPISRSLRTSAKSFVPCEVIYLQFSGVRTQTCLETASHIPLPDSYRLANRCLSPLKSSTYDSFPLPLPPLLLLILLLLLNINIRNFFTCFIFDMAPRFTTILIATICFYSLLPVFSLSVQNWT